MTTYGPIRREENISSETPFVLPLASIDRTQLSLAGGKAANLGELIQADFAVPPGFCVTTHAYNRMNSLFSQNIAPTDTAQQAEFIATSRRIFEEEPIPPEIAEEITAAYRVLCEGEQAAVAVRSSATAEDLPHASVAGQQETYLNVIGDEAVLEAVRHCWASLWTERAVSYRQNLRLDHRAVSLAVVIQRMIEAETAGVLFTANPLTGKRREAVIDANPGLGEAVVSGAVNPDHFVVNATNGKIVERHPGDKRLVIRGTEGGGTIRTERSDSSDEVCLTDDQSSALARLGARVEAHYGTPQDIEWAIDSSGQIWLTQARPITTLFPLPINAPQTDEILRVYFSFNVAQGVYRPFTPVTISLFRRLLSLVTGLFGNHADPTVGPDILAVAASRLFLDVTPALRSPFGRNILIGLAHIGEALSATLFEQLVGDPRLSLIPTRRWHLVRALSLFVLRTRVPLYILQALLWPRSAERRIARVKADLLSSNDLPPKADPLEGLTMLEQFFPARIVRTIMRVGPIIMAGIGSHALASKLLAGLATPSEMQIVLRGLPHNPTTEMDLALWALSQRVQTNPDANLYVRTTPPEQQGQDYLAGTLPSVLQQGLEDFLHDYGHRGVAEIDLGLPRWSEDPTHLLGVLSNYLQLQDTTLAPDAQFRRGAQEAEKMVVELTRRAASKSRWLGIRIAFLLKRVRLLAGLREMPKFCIVLLMAQMRKQLWSIGKALVAAERLTASEDIFFMTFAEMRAAIAGKDMRPTVRERRANYEREMQRRHIPRVLLSDGTEPTNKARSQDASGALQGSAASPGQVTARARVILNPTGAHLEPGEILVAPSTDPGWTPLFLTASALVMEMGGAMSHGAVVAREYGIPAVVGVHDATARITNGSLITVDGTTGTVILANDADK